MLRSTGKYNTDCPVPSYNLSIEVRGVEFQLCTGLFKYECQRAVREIQMRRKVGKAGVEVELLSPNLIHWRYTLLAQASYSLSLHCLVPCSISTCCSTVAAPRSTRVIKVAIACMQA